MLAAILATSCARRLQRISATWMSAALFVSCLVTAGCTSEAASEAATGGSGSGSEAQGGAGQAGAGGSGMPGGSGGTCPTATPSLARVGPTFDVPTLAQAGPKRNPDVAHDPMHDVYLVVTGTSAISGTFLDADGQSLAAPFAVAETDAYTQTPRVTYGAGKLLVVWHDNRQDPAQPELRARIVGWTGSGPDLEAPDFAITTSTYWEMGAALAFSETSQLFLVVWQTLADNDIRARRIDAAGALVGDEIALTADADWQSGAAVAWNETTDEFLVTYAHAGASGAAVRSRRIRASDGNLVAGETELGTARGTWTTQAIHLPCEDGYFVGWVADGAVGQRLNASGEPTAAPFTFQPPGNGYPDGFSVAHHATLDSMVAVMHGQTDEDWAAAFRSSGEQSSMFEATSSPGDDGHFNPRIVANRLRNEWLMVTSRGFTTIVGQRLGP